MPWISRTTMLQRHEFVLLARKKSLSFRELCGRFGIAPKTGYKWLERFAAGGEAGLGDRSRRPQQSPRQCPAPMAEVVLALRRAEPTWGGRKLRRRLQDLYYPGVPAASTCTEILRRAGLLGQPCGRDEGPFKRFARALPNELWQMDHKGDFATQSGARCFPLTVLDDCTRFNLVLEPCANQRTTTVQSALTTAFQTYGLPEA